MSSLTPDKEPEIPRADQILIPMPVGPEKSLEIIFDNYKFSKEHYINYLSKLSEVVLLFHKKYVESGLAAFFGYTVDVYHPRSAKHKKRKTLLLLDGGCFLDKMKETGLKDDFKKRCLVEFSNATKDFTESRLVSIETSLLVSFDTITESLN